MNAVATQAAKAKLFGAEMERVRDVTFRGVFFDLWGTLLIQNDPSGAWSNWVSAIHGTLTECGLSIPVDVFAARCDGFFDKPEPPPQGVGLTIYERRIRALGVDLGLQLTNAEIRSVVTREYEAWRKDVSVDPDADAVLSALMRRRTLGLVTNYDHPPHIYPLLREFGLSGFFQTVVISGAIGIRKPDPHIFLPALQEVGLQPHEVVYVGDRRTDVQGSRAAGLYPVRIQRSRPGEDVAPQESNSVCESARTGSEQSAIDSARVISRLTELVELLG